MKLLQALALISYIAVTLGQGVGPTADLAIAVDDDDSERQLRCGRTDVGEEDLAWQFDSGSGFNPLWDSTNPDDDPGDFWGVDFPGGQGATAILTIAAEATAVGTYRCLVGTTNTGIEAEVILVEGPSCAVRPTVGEAPAADVVFTCTTTLVDPDTPAEPGTDWSRDSSNTLGSSSGPTGTGAEYVDTLTYAAATVDENLYDDPHVCTVTYATANADSDQGAERTCTTRILSRKVSPTEAIVVADGSAEDVTITCSRDSEDTDEVRFYFTPYNDAGEEDKVFDTEDSSIVLPDPGPWSVASDDQLEYTLTISSVTMNLEGDSSVQVTAGTYRCETSILVNEGEPTVRVDAGGEVDVVSVVAPSCSVNPGSSTDPPAAGFEATFTCTVQYSDDSIEDSVVIAWSGNDIDAGSADPNSEADPPSSSNSVTVSGDDLTLESNYVCTATVPGVAFDDATCISLVELDQDIVPTDDVVVQNTPTPAPTATLPCRGVDNTRQIEWSFVRHDGTNVGIIYDNETPVDPASNYDVTEDGLARNLVINPVTVEEAGTYTCTVNDNAGGEVLSGTSQVVFIEPVTCNHGEESVAVGGDDVDFVCQVEKVSHTDDTDLVPSFVWTNDNNVEVTGTLGSNENTFTNTLTDTPDSGLFNDQPFTCTVGFTDEPLADSNSIACVANNVALQQAVPQSIVIGRVDESQAALVLPCQIRDPGNYVQWTFQAHDDATPNVIYDNDPEESVVNIPASFTMDNTNDLDFSLTTSTQVALADAGTYTCTISAGTGAAPSNTGSGFTNLVLIDAITCTPDIQSARLGDEVDFPCVVTKLSHTGDGDPDPTIEWEDVEGTVVPGDGTSNDPPTFTETATVTTNAAFFGAEVQGRCVVSFETDDAYSNQCTPDTLVAFTAVSRSEPIVLEDGSALAQDVFSCSRLSTDDTMRFYFTPYNGDTAVLFFDANDEDVRPDAPWIVTPDGTNADTYTLAISSVTMNLAENAETAITAGTYRCEVIEDDEAEDSGGSVEIISIATPQCSASPELAFEEDVSFACTVQYSNIAVQDDLDFSWTRGDDPVEGGESSTSAGTPPSTSNTVTVQSASVDFGENYQCSVEAATEASFTFDGNCNSQVLLGRVPENEIVEEDTQMQMLYCGLGSDPEPTVSWFFTPFDGSEEEAPINLEDGSPWSENQFADTDGYISELHIAPVSAGLDGRTITAGNYRCEITADGETEPTYDESAIVAAYGASCTLDGENAPPYVCEAWRSDPIIGAPEISFTEPDADGQSPVPADDVSDPVPVEDDLEIWQSSYTPSTGTDVIDVTFTCTAEVEAQNLSVDVECPNVSGSSNVKFSVIAIFSAIIISFVGLY